MAHIGLEQEGAARTEGGAGVTVGVMQVDGTDWLISHSHLQGDKELGVMVVLDVYAFVCV